MEQLTCGTRITGTLHPTKKILGPKYTTATFRRRQLGRPPPVAPRAPDILSTREPPSIDWVAVATRSLDLPATRSTSPSHETTATCSSRLAAPMLAVGLTHFFLVGIKRSSRYHVAFACLSAWLCVIESGAPHANTLCPSTSGRATPHGWVALPSYANVAPFQYPSQ